MVPRLLVARDSTGGPEVWDCGRVGEEREVVMAHHAIYIIYSILYLPLAMLGSIVFQACVLVLTLGPRQRLFPLPTQSKV